MAQLRVSAGGDVPQSGPAAYLDRAAVRWPISVRMLAGRADRHFTFISQLERAERSPGLMTIVTVADALEVDPGLLITRKPPADLLNVPEVNVRPGGRKKRKPLGRKRSS